MGGCASPMVTASTTYGSPGSILQVTGVRQGWSMHDSWVRLAPLHYVEGLIIPLFTPLVARRRSFAPDAAAGAAVDSAR